VHLCEHILLVVEPVLLHVRHDQVERVRFEVLAPLLLLDPYRCDRLRERRLLEVAFLLLLLDEAQTLLRELLAGLNDYEVAQLARTSTSEKAYSDSGAGRTRDWARRKQRF